MRGRGRLAAAALPAALRARRAHAEPGRLGAPTSSTRRRRSPRLPPLRRSRAGRSSPSSSRTRPTSERAATGSSRGRSRSSRRAAHAARCAALKALRNASLAPRPHDRRPERVPRARSRSAGGWTRTASHVLTNPAPPPRDVRARAARAGDVRLRRPADRARRTSPTAIAALALVPAARLVIVGDGPDRARARARRRRVGGREPDRVPRVAARATRRCGRRRRRGGPALERLGEPAALAPSRRSRSACRSSRRPSAACRRSSTTARTGCSCRPAGPTSSPPRCAACSRSQGCASGSPPRAKPSVEAISSEAIYGRLEALLAEAAAVSEQPRVLFVGRGALPAAASGLAREEVGRDRGGARLPRARRGRSRQPAALRALPARASPCGRGAWTGSSFTCCSRFASRRELREFRPDAVVASDPFVGAAALAGPHDCPSARAGDRRGARRLAHLHASLRLALARSFWRRRRTGSPRSRCGAPTRRARSPRFTSSLIEDARGRPADGIFPTYSDLSAFTARPAAGASGAADGALRGHARAVQERRRAGRRLASRRPANCRRRGSWSSGRGSQQDVIDRLVDALPDQVEYVPQLEPRDVARALDDATVLVLPSWPEGLGRVVIEAFARGRGVVATDAGGIPDLVRDGVEGILIPPADEDALVASLVRALGDRALAERLGAAAHGRYADWHSTPAAFATAYRELVDRHRSARCESSSSRRRSTRTIRCWRRRSSSSRRWRAAATRWSCSARTAGRHELPANVRVQAVRRADAREARDRVRPRDRRRRCEQRPRPDAISPHGPALPPARRALRQAAADPAPAVVHALARRAERCVRRRALADAVLSVDAGSFPLAVAEGPRDRARDRRRSASRPPRPSAPRTAPCRFWRWDGMPRWKGYKTMLRGRPDRRRAGPRRPSGGPRPRADADRTAHHRAELERLLARTPSLAGRVNLGDSLSRELVPALIAGSDVLVSATQPQSCETLDKVRLRGGGVRRAGAREQRALSKGSSTDCRCRCGFRPGTPRLWRSGCSRSLRPDREVRHELGAELRRRVVAGHSVDSWADAVVAAVSGLRRQ